MLTLTSHPSNVAKVEPFVEHIVKEYGVRPDVYGNILITITEAVTNAIIHGNDNDESKKVQVSIKKDENKLAFYVSDEGPGFDPNSIPDPTAPENLLKIGGRGVFLIKQLADHVVFSNNGSTVEIHFKI